MISIANFIDLASVLDEDELWETYKISNFHFNLKKFKRTLFKDINNTNSNDTFEEYNFEENPFIY
jgi:hypothetical protein